jgi:Concanavalin A-like lectin/glucanases superfamily
MSSNQQALLMAGGDESTPPVAICVPDPYYTPTTEETYWTSTVLLLHFEEGNGATTVFDKSIRGRASTANGNAVVTTGTSKFGTGSAYFDGTGDFFQFNSSNSDWNFGTGDFTVECWVKNSLSGVDNKHIVGNFVSNFSFTWVLRIVNSVLYWVYVDFLGTTIVPLIGTIAVNDNQWHHIAATRASGTLRLFVDGVLDGSVAHSIDYTASTSARASVGADAISRVTARDYIGYIDEVRVTKGVARYTATFTQPTAQFTENKTATLLMLHGEVIEDSSSYARTLSSSGVSVNTTAPAIGTGSLQNTGATNTNLAVPDSGDWDLYAVSYTIEFWLKTTATAQFKTVFSRARFQDISNSGVYIGALNRAASSGKFAFFVSDYNTSTNNPLLESTTSVNDGNWHHIAVVRDVGNHYLFVDGIAEATRTGTYFFIGSRANSFSVFHDLGALGYELAGQVDEFRVTYGAARYTADFTPETLPFCNSTSGGTSIPTSGTEYPDGQQLTTSQGTLTIANPWVKLSGNQLTASPGSVSPTLPNKTAALTGTSATVSAGTVLTSNKTVALIGASATARNNGSLFGGYSLYIPPYPDFTRVPTPTSYGVTVALAGTSAIIRLLLNADGSISINVPIGTLTYETNRPTVWLYNSFPDAYDIATVANAYYLQESSISGPYGAGTYTSDVVMNNGVDMSAGGYWEVEYTTPTNKPATFTKIIITGPKTNNPRYGEFNYYGIFYFTFTITL